MALTRLGPNQAVNLASNVTGTLPVANGGTALTSGFTNGKVGVRAYVCTSYNLTVLYLKLYIHAAMDLS